MKTMITELLSKHQKGLLLLDMPTGTGKTYQIINFIAEKIDTLKTNHQKIIFITSLKKNLPINELQKQLEMVEKSSYFDEVLFLSSKIDNFLLNFNNCIDDIKDFLPNFNYHTLYHIIKNYQNQKAIQSIIDEQLNLEINKLKNQIKLKLHQEFKNNQKQLDALIENQKYQWIIELFPEILILDKSVIFMSVDKFINPIDTLINPIIPITELLNEYKTWLFIDEFDHSKQKLQNYIIEQGLKNPIDPIRVTKQIYSTFVVSQFPNHLLPEWKLIKQPATPAEIEQNIKEIGQEIFYDYHLLLSLKSKENNNNNSFIFYDKTAIYINNNKYNRLTLNADYSQNTLWIENGEKNKNTNDNLTLGMLLGKTYQFINYFKGGINMLANNYLANHRLAGIGYDNALRSYLDFFGFQEQDFNGLLYDIQYGNQIKRWSNHKQSNIESYTTDYFYQNGFSYHTIIDDDNHFGRSKIKTYHFSYTPESLLLDWCRHFMVIGVSATASITSRLGNYDLNYIKNQLNIEKDCQFIQLNQEQQNILQNQLKESIKNYHHIDIEVKTKGIDSKVNEQQLKSLYVELFGGNDFIEDVEHLFFDIKIDDIDNKIHQLKQFYKIFELYIDYQTKNINAFLLLFSKGYKNDLDFIKKYCQILSENLKLPDNTDEMICIVGDESEQQIQSIKSQLADGKRRFVLSTYATLGLGVNLQYDIPNKFKNTVIKTNDYKDNNKMDFDGLYLDKPTNLIARLSLDKDNKEQELVKKLFQLEYLKLSGLTQDNFKAHLENAFLLFLKQKPINKQKENLYEFDDYKWYVMQLLIQGIGRICRTNQKLPNIRLYIDTEIQSIWLNQPKLQMALPEFNKIDEFINQSNYQKLSNNNTKVNFIKSHSFINKILERIRNGTMQDEHINDWENLRKFVLINPQRQSNLYHAYYDEFDFYIKFDEPKTSYHYLEQKDYQEIQILSAKINHSKEVSVYSAQLERLMQHQGIYQHFISNHYATTFIASDTWLNPIIFNNIYKGAIGEVAGHYLWHSYGLPKLDALPNEYYELFDYKVNDNIYVDFKHWHTYHNNGNEIREKIYQKMIKINARLVFVINIIADNPNLKPLICHSANINNQELLIVELPYFIKQDNQSDIEQLKQINQLIQDYH